jgi:hypothetical protein
MEKSKLLKVLEIEYTEDIKVVYSAAKKYARKVHPDQNPDMKQQWLEFELAYNVIKRMSDTRKSFNEYDFELSKTPGWARNQNGSQNSSKSSSSQGSKTHSSSGPKAQKQKPQGGNRSAATKGSDLFHTEGVTFDQIVYGCDLFIKRPVGSAAPKNPTAPGLIHVRVTPTPLWTNQDGSISKRSLGEVFQKKVVIYGAGQAGNNGGLAGNLIITFDIDISVNQATRDIISQHFKNRNSYRNSRNPSTPYSQFFDEVFNNTNSAFDEATKEKSPPNSNYKSPTQSSTVAEKQSSKTQFKVALAFVLIGLLGFRVYENNIKQAQQNAAFSVCQYVQTLDQAVSADFFAQESNPWAAALDSGFFKPASNSPDQISYQAYADVLPSANLEEISKLTSKTYGSLKSDYKNFVNYLNSQDHSYSKYAYNLVIDCATLDKNGGFGW